MFSTCELTKGEPQTEIIQDTDAVLRVTERWHRLKNFVEEFKSALKTTHKTRQRQRTRTEQQARQRTQPTHRVHGQERRTNQHKRYPTLPLCPTMRYCTSQEKPSTADRTVTNVGGREYRKPARETQAKAKRKHEESATLETLQGNLRVDEIGQFHANRK